jgi:hypothetical protein
MAFAEKCSSNFAEVSAQDVHRCSLPGVGSFGRLHKFKEGPAAASLR